MPTITPCSKPKAEPRPSESVKKSGDLICSARFQPAFEGASGTEMKARGGMVSSDKDFPGTLIDDLVNKYGKRASPK